MSEHDEHASALDSDNPSHGEEAGDKGLGTETGAEGGPGDSDQDVTKMMPDARGDVKYPDKEEFSGDRPTTTPQEGRVEEDAETVDEASDGAED